MIGTITEKYRDLSGKWIVRVMIDDRNTTFLNFNEEPSQEEVLIATNKFLSTSTTTKNIEDIKQSIIIKLQNYGFTDEEINLMIGL